LKSLHFLRAKAATAYSAS